LNKKLRRGIGDVRLVKEENKGGKVKALRIKKKRDWIGFRSVKRKRI